jgi:apolipoprotein N-acyltransferase
MSRSASVLLESFAGRLVAAAGWRRAAYAFGLGVLTVAALPPVGAVPVLWVTLPALLWLLDGAKRTRTAFAIGWWFHFGYFAFGLYWVSIAMLVDFDQHWPLLPLSATVLPAGLALFGGLATLIVHLAVPARRLARIPLLAVGWVVAEWLRGHLLTGFPWNLIGYAWTEALPVLQSAAWIGIYGLSAVTVLATAAPAALVWRRDRAGWLPPVAGLAVLLAFGGAGLVRLASIPVGDVVPNVRLRLVQLNVSQNQKWRAESREKIFNAYLDQSRALPEAGQPAPSVVIWPETAVPALVDSDPKRRAAIAGAVPRDGLIITGAPRIEAGPDKNVKYWNSLFAIDDLGFVAGSFDKAHLVPFGEYVPLRGVLPLEPLVAGRADFSAGPGPRTLLLPGLPPVSPLICYEVIFPGVVTAFDGLAPRWLLNITNDAWFGFSAGPYQHFAIARVRSVETGLPLVRVANAGISGVVDAAGRVRAALRLGAEGALDADLPGSLPIPPLYHRFGDWIVLGLLALLSLCAVWDRRVRLS